MNILVTSIVVVAILVIGYRWFQYPSKATKMELATLKGGMRFPVLVSLSCRLKMGMTKDEVEKHLGKPDNYDKQCVWMWTNISDSTNQIKWADHYFNESAMFLLFHENRLISPLLSTAETTPWAAYKSFAKCNQSDAERALGEKEPEFGSNYPRFSK